jgi:hypothetical protein
MRYLAALGAVIAALLVTTTLAASSDTGDPPAANAIASFAVSHDTTGWHARVVISEAAPPPPGIGRPLYTRIIVRDGATRSAAITNLIGYLGALVGTADLEFPTIP